MNGENTQGEIASIKGEDTGRGSRAGKPSRNRFATLELLARPAPSRGRYDRMILILITFVLGGLAATGLVFFTLKALATKAAGGGGSDFVDQEEAIRVFDQKIETALEYLSPMLPLADALQREQEISALRNDLAVEARKLQDLDSQLSRLQGMVETAESAHNELKKGKEDCDSIADEVRSRKEQLISEAAKLENELQQSRAQLTMLSDEVSMTKEQKAALNSIMSALDNSQKQLSALGEVWTVASTRFVNLETQYRELEKEFTKLVEKELSGKTG